MEKNKMPNYMNIQEFVEKGYLQEANRLFFHPLGLALEVTLDEDGNYELSGVWDYRGDPEGMVFDLENSDKERIERFRKNEKYIADQFLKYADYRKKMWKYACNVEPIPEK